MFRYRRVRVLTVLLSGWVALTAVERWAERAPWPSAVLGGLLWSGVVAGVWWFAEWTQQPLRTARESRAARESEGTRQPRGEGACETRDEATDGEYANVGDAGTRRSGSPTPSRH
ncbi:hypothetical protein ACIRJR_19465 [Streptomyces sp. NPDC102402]|uniref:hypothetical protein n=1 Tax=Streptomyces sp. NPDC102402 TaxID=3366169 RepID=UPI003822BC9D